MDRDEREKNIKILTKIWEKQIKGNPKTLQSWSKHPKSFVKWSMNRIRRFCGRPYQLTLLNDECDIKKPYNLVYIPREEIKKRGRKKND